MCAIMLKLTLHFSRRRDIAKNSLLRWPVFLYWTCLGVFDAVIFFFGAYFLFDNTTFTSNGQVSLQAGGDGSITLASSPDSYQESSSPLLLLSLWEGQE